MNIGKNSTRLENILLFAAMIFIYFGTAVSTIFAQGTDLGTIQGIVTDSSGAVISNAKVEVLNTDTNLTLPFTTGSQGTFSAADIQSGHYKVTVTAAGFAAAVVEKIILQGTTTMNLRPVLRVSTASTTVQVTSAANLINTQNSTISRDPDQLWMSTKFLGTAATFISFCISTQIFRRATSPATLSS